MAPLPKPGDRFWRTDTTRNGRSIYALKSNDIELPSTDDPLIGVMESSLLAEDIVDLHNNAIRKYGRHFRRVMAAEPEVVNSSSLSGDDDGV